MECFVVESFVVESSLLNNCCGTCVAFLLWNLCCEILVVECVVVGSLLWNALLRSLCCGVIVDE